MSEEHRATDIGNINIQKKFGKDRVCGSGDILADRQTHRQTYSPKYLATAPAGEVINAESLKMLSILIAY